mgnify:CR=1 FL=1
MKEYKSVSFEFHFYNDTDIVRTSADLQDDTYKDPFDLTRINELKGKIQS